MSVATIARPAGVPTRGAEPVAAPRKGAAVNDRMLAPSEVAHRLRVTEETVRRWVRSGHLPSVKIGPRTIRIPESAIAPQYPEQEVPDGE